MISDTARMVVVESSANTQGVTSEIITKGDGEVTVKNWKEHQLCVRTSFLKCDIY